MGKGLLLCAAFGLISLALAWPVVAQDKPPLVIAKQSYFYVGGHYDTEHDTRHMVGQMYVEYHIPAQQTHPFPS